MSEKAKPLPPHLQVWIEARKRYRLSHAHVQMARELGLNPKKLGGLANHRQEPWKAPLPQFIEGIYAKRFGRERPRLLVRSRLLPVVRIWCLQDPVANARTRIAEPIATTANAAATAA